MQNYCWYYQNFANDEDCYLEDLSILKTACKIKSFIISEENLKIKTYDCVDDRAV